MCWERLAGSFCLGAFVWGAFGLFCELLAGSFHYGELFMRWELLAGTFRLRAFVCELLVCCGSCWLGAFILCSFWYVLGAFDWELSFGSF